MDEDAAYRDPVYLDVLEKLTEAWSAGRKVKINHQMEGGRIFEYTFSPYFIEPYAVGQTAHVIGYREPPGAVRTFKIERLRSAQILSDEYDIPADFDPKVLLRDAWGIWFSEREPVEVVLRFHPSVAMRVKESRWHHSQQIEQQPDGYLLWRARVAEPQEMLPWVRGWGADVEVLEPLELRFEVISQVEGLLGIYGMELAKDGDSRTLRVLRCWGKTGKTDAEFHPAVFHMLDVANVAKVLLEGAPRFRRVLALALNSEEQQLANWLPWIIALHDIGKISASFQGQNPTQKGRLGQEGFSFSGWSASDDKPHGIISQAFIEELLDRLDPSPSRSLRRAVAEAIGGHHGAYASRDTVKKAKFALSAIEPQEWSELRIEAEVVLRDQLLQCDLSLLPAPVNVSTGVMALSGFTILCDWIGSDSRFFKPHSDIALERYSELSRRQARQAVVASGILTDSASAAPTSFSDLFFDISEPRPLQLAVDAIPDQLLAQPCLTIIEAPTGEGKTEAALTLAHRIAEQNGGDDLYYALPTMATSNQMFGRLQKHLQARLGMETQIKLVL